uniref:Uncharacterized protein n=1 Tax=Steinernema glaseri TaxID=37863 RepID=A0A1I7Y8J7_9BILA
MRLFLDLFIFSLLFLSASAAVRRRFIGASKLHLNVSIKTSDCNYRHAPSLSLHFGRVGPDEKLLYHGASKEMLNITKGIKSGGQFVSEFTLSAQEIAPFESSCYEFAKTQKVRLQRHYENCMHINMFNFKFSRRYYWKPEVVSMRQQYRLADNDTDTYYNRWEGGNCTSTPTLPQGRFYIRFDKKAPTALVPGPKLKKGNLFV